MTGSILVLGIIIFINLLVVIGVLYVGTRGHHESHVSASDSTAAVAWGKLAKNAPVVQVIVEHDESVVDEAGDNIDTEDAEVESEVADDAETEAED